MIVDHEPISVETFGGLWGRDRYNDSVPADHFIDSLNTITLGDEIDTRFGFTPNITLANIRQIATYRRQGEADRLLILDNTGKLFDATASLSTPILNIAAMTGFALATIFNRAYISPHNGISGLPGEFVYVYQGSGTARKAAGVKPSSGFTVTLSATAGNVETGTHIFAWCFETDTGFITPPGPTTFQTIVTDGTKALDFSSIPTGPAGTAARRLIGSRAIQTYNGDQEGYEMFFVPGGKISNNSATTLSAVNFFDADLQESADYTFDEKEEIPAVLFINPYGNRIVYGSTDTDKSLAYISVDSEPESINSLAGFIVFDPSETDGIKSSVEFRKNLYVMKHNPGHTYVTTDNSYEPSTWNVDTIDHSIGCDVNGTSQFFNRQGSSSDFFIVADNSGLFAFNGTYGDPKLHLAYKIQNWWDRINKAAMNKLQLVIDPEKFLIYVNVPLDSATSPSHIFVGDYSDGFNWKDISWHIWSSTAFAPASIAIAINNTTKKSYLRVGAFAGNVFDYDENSRNDNGSAIDSYIKFALLYNQKYTNWVQHFGEIGLRIKGDGTLLLELVGLDDTLTQTPASLTLSATPGGELRRAILFQNEKCSVKLRVNSANKYFQLRALYLYANPLWASRPQ